jgi:DNA repair exonuclease SbcCD ATPase subunit
MTMTKQPKLNLADMKALLPPVPVIATESLEQVEKIFDQVVATLNIADMVELLLIREFVLPSWEIARYTRHRVVAFDRKFKDTLASQVAHLQSQKARREALAKRLAEYLGQRPPEVSHLENLENKVTEARDEIADILKHTPSELAYNQALERSIEFHKDLEFLITSMSKRRDEALEMLSRYREGLGRRAKEVTEEILNAEYKVISENQAPEGEVENQIPQLALPRTSSPEPTAENEPGPDHSATNGPNQLDVAP